jgi:type I restriction enzyme, S subunit
VSTLNRNSLPRGWANVKLRDVVSPIRSKVQPSELPDLQFIGMEHIEAHTTRLLATVSASTMKSSAVQFERGDILYGRLRPYLNKVHVPEFKGLCSAEFIVLTPHSGVDARLVQYLLNSAPFVSFSSGLNTGDRPRVDFDGIGEYQFAISPTEEQRRIVAQIETLITKLDVAVAALERVRANLKRYRASVLKAAVEGRLVSTEAELARKEGRAFEPASVLLDRILTERRRRWEESELARMKAAGKPPKDDSWKSKYKEPVAPDTSAFLPLPEGWCWATAEQLACGEEYALTIGPFGSNLKVSDYAESGVPLIFVRNIRSEEFSDRSCNFISQSKAATLRPHWVIPGDILVTKMGDPPGDACIYPRERPIGVITADCIRWAPSASLPSRNLLVQIVRSDLVQGQILSMTKGVAQRKVSLARFRRLAIPLAPLAEQSRIIAQIDRLLSISGQNETLVQVSVDRIGRLRQSILKWAFEGKLADQDPNDEPAAILLERIRSERATVSKPSRKSRKPSLYETEAAK